jgi:hypothetical protein
MGDEMGNEIKGLWIPQILIEDERLTPMERILLAKIDFIYNEEHCCFASNKYLAEYCKCSETSISTSISKLIKLGYLAVQKYDGKNRELRSMLSKFENNAFKNSKVCFQNLKDKKRVYKKSENKEKNNNNIIIKKRNDIGFDLDEFFNAACLRQETTEV